MLFEAGRVGVPFLLNLNYAGSVSSVAENHKKTRQIVNCLRTSMSHNLGFDEGHDLEIRRLVSEWFVETCGSIFPTSAQDWGTCFGRLCEDVLQLIRYCSISLSATVAAPLEDKRLVFDDLKKRINREWEAHQFDKLIEDSAARMGELVNARAFRERRLTDWRRVIATLPDDANVELVMARIIDGELANHFRARLPIGTQELMRELNLPPGPEVKRALEIARQAFEGGVTDSAQLMAMVKARYHQVT